MTPYEHAKSSANKFGGVPTDYIELHDWFDCTKSLTGDWGHRALRHHAAGIQWAVEKFGHFIKNSHGSEVATKLIAEQHVKEDCGFIPRASDWTDCVVKNPKDWMLKVKTRSKELNMVVQ
jgi:hypothetical protein